MGGRGSFAAGNTVAYIYEMAGMIEDVKVLRGLNGKHSLPEESHSSSAYIKLKPDGRFHEMRIYDEDHYLTLEIAYHVEPNIGGYEKPVLHYHRYDRNFKRTDAVKLDESDEIFAKYKKYFKGVVL